MDFVFFDSFEKNRRFFFFIFQFFLVIKFPIRSYTKYTKVTRSANEMGVRSAIPEILYVIFCTSRVIFFFQRNHIKIWEKKAWLNVLSNSADFFFWCVSFRWIGFYFFCSAELIYVMFSTLYWQWVNVLCLCKTYWRQSRVPTTTYAIIIIIINNNHCLAQRFEFLFALCHSRTRSHTYTTLIMSFSFWFVFTSHIIKYEWIKRIKWKWRTSFGICQVL